MPNRTKPTPKPTPAVSRTEEQQLYRQTAAPPHMSRGAQGSVLGGPLPFRPADILTMQRTVGNRAVGELLAAPTLQRQPNSTGAPRHVQQPQPGPINMVQLQRWNQPGGKYRTRERCTLRARNHTAIERIEPDSLIDIADNPEEEEFRLHIFNENHVWVRHGQNRGWVRENAIGGRDPGSLVDAYTAQEMGGLPRLPTRMPHPDRQKYVDMKPYLKPFVAGVDTQGAPLAAVKKILANIVDNGLFRYIGAYTSPLNFMSGTNDGGDCRTLSESIHIIMTNVLQMGGTTVKSKQQRFRINNQKPTLDGTNVNAVDHWEFDNHYWLDVSGTPYDVLFNANLDRSRWVNM